MALFTCKQNLLILMLRGRDYQSLELSQAIVPIESEEVSSSNLHLL